MLPQSTGPILVDADGNVTRGEHPRDLHGYLICESVDTAMAPM
jgi:hypothetical protein